MAKSNPATKAVVATIAALSFLVAATTIIGTLTFCALPVALKTSNGPAYPWLAYVIAGLSTFVGLVFGFWTMAGLEPGTGMSKRAASDLMFTRYLVGIGYFLFVDAIINIVAFAGFAKSGALDQIFPFGTGDFKNSPSNKEVITFIDRAWEFLIELFSPDKRIILTVILMLSLGMAVLGALFFFANALWAKFKSGTVIFDRNIFWGGLWFRLAEAIVFTIAIFLFMRFQGYNTNYMPIIALFIGMTVKSSEGLIFGLADRLLALVTILTQPRTQATGNETRTDTVPGPETPQVATAEEISDLIRKYLEQGAHKDKIKSVEVKPGAVAHTFSVVIKATLPNDQRRDLLIAEIRRMARSAVRTKNVNLDVEVETAI